MNTRTIVVGVDASRASEAALEWAIHEAASSGAEIVAVHVVRPVVPPALAMTVADTPRVESQRWWSDLHARVEADYCRLLVGSSLAYRVMIEQGHPATEILRVADEEEADLVVVGNGLHSTMTELFLGSVAHELSHHSRRPLVIVPVPVGMRDVDALGTKQRAAINDKPAMRDYVLAGVSPIAVKH